MVSLEWTGTTVARPSGCLRKVWLPLVRTAREPAHSRMQMISLPLSRGGHVIPKRGNRVVTRQGKVRSPQLYVS